MSTPSRAHFLRRIWLPTMAISLSSCGASPADYSSATPRVKSLQAFDAVPTEDLANDARSKKNLQDPSQSTKPDLGLPETFSLVGAKFKVVAKTAGADSCTGQLNIKVNGSLSSTNTTQLLQIPSGGIDCGILGKVDLGQMFGSFSEPPPKGEDPMVIANNVLSLKALGPGTYTPPRPFLPSFLATAKDELAKLNYTVQNITLKTPKGTAKGNVSLKMNYYDKPLTAPGTTYQFKHVMDFTVTNTGFEGIDKSTNFVYDSIQFTMSTSPVAIIGIKLKGNTKSQLIAQKDKLNAVTGLMKIITMIANADPTGLILAVTGLIPMDLELTLMEQDDLAQQLAAAEATSAEKIGEVIGGQPTR